MDFRSISEGDFSQYVDLMSVVLITVTKIETECLHERLTPLPNTDEILVVQRKFYTYYLGMLGEYAVCHVESRMGTSGAGASTMTVLEAIEFIKPAFIIMVGIAFGVNEKEQRIGDVLVSELIVQYENAKIKNGTIQYRGYKQMASVILYNRFTSPLGWKFPLTKNRNSKIWSGHLLSGEKLIDDRDYRDKLSKTSGSAIGGEMEGVGLASVAHSYNTNWLVVKGICDFADGNKGVNKDKKQYVAARAAVDLCCSIFKDKFTFKDLGVLPINIDSPSVGARPTLDHKIFAESTFNAYSETKERFYLVREVDKAYINFLEAKSNIWSIGDSGLGKTSMTFRNLIQAGKQMFLIDFSSADTNDMLSVLDYMHTKLLESVSPNSIPRQTSIMQAMDSICGVLNRYFSNTYIIIEEMPVDEGSENMFKHMFLLIVKNSIQYPDSNVNFVFTSIGDPKKFVPSMADKIDERVNFIRMHDWNDDEMKALLKMMSEAVDFGLSSKYIDLMVLISDKNPRKLKTNFRNLVISSQKDQPLELSLQQYFDNAVGNV